MNGYILPFVLATLTFSFYKEFEMKKTLRIVASFIAALMACILILPVAACAGGDNVIRITSMGGLPLANVTVTVYDGDSAVASGTTNGNGEYSLTLSGNNLNAKLTNLPAGYKPEASYKLDASKTENVIKVTSGIITDEDIPNDLRFQPGLIMYDFELLHAYVYEENATSLAWKTVKLSELAEGKKAVLINFFFTTCGPCDAEIPAMLKVYDEIKDDVAIVGITTAEMGDNDALVAAFVNKHKSSYYMAMDTAGITNRFTPAVSAYPTSVMIDRYGFICEREEGSQDSEDFWRAWFARYTSDDYEQTQPDDDNNNSTFTPDKPVDYDKVFSANGMDRINKTGTPVTFYGPSDESTWPWELDADGESVVTSNKGHYYTSAILYAKVNIPAGKALAFDYDISGLAGYDYFYIAVDPNGGMGTQMLEDSGDFDWRTGYAYVPLEAGEHDIAFAYYKQSSEANIGNLADTVKIKNLRFVDVSEFVADSEPMDIPYYAARGITDDGGFAYYEDVALESDGFYHVQGRNSSAGDAPMMYVDMYSPVPFFTDPSHTATIASEFVSKTNFLFNGTDYSNKLSSYNNFARNASLSGLIPVNDDVKDMLTDIYVETISKEIGYQTFWDPENGWQEFCVFYVHYGEGESYGNTIEGVAPFTAYKAVETTGLANTSEKINVAYFDRVYMPRGQMFEFVPEKSGVYQFRGINSLDGAGNPVAIGKDAWLLDGDDFEDEYTSYLQVKDINSCGSDYYIRNQVEGFDFENVNFNMYHYLEAGHTYYVMVAFSVVEQLGELKFRIDYLDTQHYDYLTTCTAGYLVQGEGNVFARPIYTQVEKNADGYYVDSNTKKPIYCDFTDLSRMFNLYSIGELLKLTGNVKFDTSKIFDFSNARVTEVYGEKFEARDYTDDLKEYYAKSIEGKQVTDDLYGLVEVDETLRAILILFYANNVGFDTRNEWLTACWYYDYTDASKPCPDTLLYPTGRS